MRPQPILTALFTMLLFTSAASAQEWTRVPDLPAANVFSLRAQDDTLIAGTVAVVYLSLDGGATWRASPRARRARRARCAAGHAARALVPVRPCPWNPLPYRETTLLGVSKQSHR